MPLPLIRRLVKGSRLNAVEHDQNLNVIEQAIAEKATAAALSQVAFTGNFSDLNNVPPGAQGINGQDGAQGIQGLQGLIGPQGGLGPAGAQGLAGFVGPQGVQGTLGVQGFAGADGLQGFTGSQGSIGTQGIQGLQGLTGAGNQGTQGITGSQGSTGIQGSQGLQGRQGTTGSQGATGTQGTLGTQGATGAGAQGITGTQGTQGIQGVQGPSIQGVQGLNGTGAFPIINSVVVTSNLAAGASENLNLPGGNKFLLLSLTASTPAWVRVYGDTTARSNDSVRTSPGGVLPLAGTGYYYEAKTTSTPETIVSSPISPLVQGSGGNAFIRVRNDDSVSRVITLTFNISILEN